MAKQFVREQLEKRDDIVGAFVVGSVARGDATEASDIDLALIVEGHEGEELQRGGLDTWRDGVYIEAVLVPQERYSRFEEVMQFAPAATHMNDALILHDPTGRYTRVQREVRAAFMEPKWLRSRVDHQLNVLQVCLSGLQDSVADGDLLGVCWFGIGVPMWLAFVPLIMHGITPSSTRALNQLEGISPELIECICAWEGSTGMSPDDVHHLIPSVAGPASLPVSSQTGRMGEYFTAKADWMVGRGRHREALHVLWMVMAVTAGVHHDSEDPVIRSTATDYAHSWLQAVGWEGQEVLEAKVRMAEEMVAEVAAMAVIAAHLPSDDAAEAG